MTAAERLNYLLKSKGMNMHKLAEKSGVPYSTIYMIIKRNSNSISYSNAIKLASALDVPADWLINKETNIDFSGNDYSLAKEETKKRIDALGEAITRGEMISILSAREDLAEYEPILNKLLSYVQNKAKDVISKEIKIEDVTDANAYHSLLHAFSKLNNLGRDIAIERVEELTEIPKYQKEKPQTENPSEDE